MGLRRCEQEGITKTVVAALCDNQRARARVCTSGITLACVLLWVVLGLDVANNAILMTTDYQGRNTGEAFVLFGNKDDSERALEKNRETIGHRWEKYDDGDDPNWLLLLLGGRGGGDGVVAVGGGCGRRCGGA